MGNRLSIKENNETLGENMEDGMEVGYCIFGLFDKGRGRFLVKTAIKSRGEDDEDTK
jgi:hypothetical protein